jgi:hypothetical protein
MGKLTPPEADHDLPIVHPKHGNVLLTMAHCNLRNQVAYVLSALGSNSIQLIANNRAVPRADVLRDIISGAREYTGIRANERPTETAMEFAAELNELGIDRVLTWLARASPNGKHGATEFFTMMSEFSDLPKNIQQQLKPIFHAFGKALAAHGKWAGKTSQALYANTNPHKFQQHGEYRESVHVQSWSTLANMASEIVLQAFAKAQLGPLTDHDVQQACGAYTQFCDAFNRLQFLRQNFPELYTSLDLRHFAEVQFASQNGTTCSDAQIQDLRALIGKGFGQDRIANFERERESGKLTVHTVTKATKRGPTVVDCATSYAINERWSALDWWARGNHDDGLAQSCLVTGAESQKDRRQLYSCNWLAVTHDTQCLHGISIDVERSEDPPVPYLGSLILNAEELKRCPAKLPQNRADVQEAERLASAAVGAFMPVKIGNVPHWAIEVRASEAECKAYMQSRIDGKSSPLGTQLFEAMEHARALSTPAPVLVWCSASKEQGIPRTLKLIFGPNPVSNATMAEFDQARHEFKAQMKDLHDDPLLPTPSFANNHQTLSATSEPAVGSQS